MGVGFNTSNGGKYFHFELMPIWSEYHEANTYVIQWQRSSFQFRVFQPQVGSYEIPRWCHSTCPSRCSVPQDSCYTEGFGQVSTVPLARECSNGGLISNLRYQMSPFLSYFASHLDKVDNLTKLQIFHHQLTHLLPVFLCTNDLEFAGICADCGCRDCLNWIVNTAQYIFEQFGYPWEVSKSTANLLQFMQVLPLAAGKQLVAQDVLQQWVVNVYWCISIANVCLPGNTIVMDCEQLVELRYVACFDVMWLSRDKTKCTFHQLALRSQELNLAIHSSNRLIWRIGPLEAVQLRIA